jgi:hypothetical protein
MKTIRAPHTRVPELDLLLFKCGRRFGEADGCAVAESLCRSTHSLVQSYSAASSMHAISIGLVL